MQSIYLRGEVSYPMPCHSNINRQLSHKHTYLAAWSLWDKLGQNVPVFPPQPTATLDLAILLLLCRRCRPAIDWNLESTHELESLASWRLKY